jgi:hypothetical protein
MQALRSCGYEPITDETLAELKAKHPQGPIPTLPEGEVLKTLVATSCQVLKAIKSFPYGSAPGPDGFHARYLFDCAKGRNSSSRIKFLDALTKVVNLIINGDVDEDMYQHLASASLVALRKPKGGIRPIAVGNVLRRLAGKVITSMMKDRFAEILSPNQVGTATPSGAEALVHAAQQFISSHGSDTDRILFKVDLTNAFNCVDRHQMFVATRKHVPEMSAFVESCYRLPPPLYTERGDVILSSQGVQQGDPLGPVLFSLVLHQVIEKLKSLELDFNHWYLDDGVIIGSYDQVKKAIDILMEIGPKFGLFLNLKKSELWWPSIITEKLMTFPADIERVSGSGVELLGCPLGDASFANNYVAKKLVAFEADLDRIASIEHSQYEFLLLKYCAGIPRFIWCLRSRCPFEIREAIIRFDVLLDRGLQRIWGTGIKGIQRRFIALPTRQGGFGIPIAVNIASAAYLGSLAQSWHLQNRILKRPRDFTQEDDPVFSRAIGNFNEILQAQLTFKQIVGFQKPQRVLTRMFTEFEQTRLFDETPTCLRPIFLAARQKCAQIWTQCLPSREWDHQLKFENYEFKLLLRARSGVAPFPDMEYVRCPMSSCQKYKMQSDFTGNHALGCDTALQTARHEAIKNLMFEEFRRADYQVVKEQSVKWKDNDAAVLDQQALRPGDIYVHNYDGAQDLAIDFSVTMTTRNTALAGEHDGYNRLKKEEEKDKKYLDLCASRDVNFFPFVLETHGGISPECDAIIDHLAKRQAPKFSTTSDSIKNKIRKKLIFTVLKYTGRLLHVGQQRRDRIRGIYSDEDTVALMAERRTDPG